MVFTEAVTEQVTAALALLLALVAMGGAVAIPTQYDMLRGRTWYWSFVLLGLAAALGAMGQGLQMSFSLYRQIWHVINFSLGISVGLLAAAAAVTRWGERAAWPAILLGLLVGIGYGVTTTFYAGVYLQGFLALAALAQLFALLLFFGLWRAGESGAGLVTGGLILTLVASLLPVLLSPGLPLLLQLDSQGLFLLLATVAVALVATGAARNVADA